MASFVADRGGFASRCESAWIDGTEDNVATQSIVITSVSRALGQVLSVLPGNVGLTWVMNAAAMTKMDAREINQAATVRAMPTA